MYIFTIANQYIMNGSEICHHSYCFFVHDAYSVLYTQEMNGERNRTDE